MVFGSGGMTRRAKAVSAVALVNSLNRPREARRSPRVSVLPKPPKGEPKAKDRWGYGFVKPDGGGYITVFAHTKGEARGLIKQQLRLDRLPVGAVVHKINKS